MVFRRLFMFSLLAAVAAEQQVNQAQQRYGGPLQFKPAFQVMDPAFYKEVLAGFQHCIQAKCTVTSSYDSYGKDPTTGLNAIGAYTACASSCIASEMLNIAAYYKDAFGKMYNIGVNQLKAVKGYIAGNCDFDVLGNRTRIWDSCCLPDDYFVKWKDVVVPAYLTINGGEVKTPVHVSAEYFVEYCSNKRSYVGTPLKFIDDAAGGGVLGLECENSLYQYLVQLQSAVGHLIINPKYDSDVPDGACNAKYGLQYGPLKPNPRATAAAVPLCVAYKVRVQDEDTEAYADEFNDEDDVLVYLKHHIIQTPVEGKCEDIEAEIEGGRKVTVYMRYTKPSDCDVYTVTGLIRRSTELYFFKYCEECALSVHNFCEFNGILSNPDFSFSDFGGGLLTDFSDYIQEGFADCLTTMEWVYIPTASSPRGTPEDPVLWEEITWYQYGPLEYCNMKQYANHLTKQLFDYSDCQIHGPDDLYEGETLPLSWLYDYTGYNIACLYRMATLKCDCMQAVVNCYENEEHFTSALGKTLGRAASVLCGFILCQKESVFYLFSDQSGVNHATIMKEILLQTGAMDATSSLPIASVAFLSFGVGMVTLFAAKKVASVMKPRVSSLEDGYRNLI